MLLVYFAVLRCALLLFFVLCLLYCTYCLLFSCVVFLDVCCEDYLNTASSFFIQCIDGEKSIPATCQWIGMVQWSGEDELQETKLTVAKKYCTEGGLTKPKNKIIDC